jgi:antitoxin HicB
MKRDQFIRILRLAAKHSELIVDTARGKGGHYVLRFGGRFSVIQVRGNHACHGTNYSKAAWLAGEELRLAMHYTAKFEKDGDGWLVTFPALPEAITGGETRALARVNAIDALEVVMLTYVNDGRTLPPDQPVREAEAVSIAPSAQVMAKIGFIENFRNSGLTRVALASRLGKAESEVRRMLDPYHGTKLPALEAAMNALGKRFVLSVEEA